MAELGLIVGIGVAVQLDIVAGFFDAVAIAAPGGIIFKPAHAPAVPILARLLHGGRWYFLSPAPQVRCGLLVPTPECMAVHLALMPRHVGVAVLFAIIHVPPAVVAEVPASAFDAVMEAAALDFVEFAGRHLPAFLPVTGRPGSIGSWVAGIPG